jgi:hypothetical protein
VEEREVIGRVKIPLAKKVSNDVKIGVHKAVSDTKIAAHEAGSKLKKRYL